MTDPAPGTLIIRTDASAEIGTGHVMRCLALAQAWQDLGGQATFAMAMHTPVLEGRLDSEGFEVIRLPAVPGSPEDAVHTAELAARFGAGWVVVDGYHFDVGYQRSIKKSGVSLLVIDDTAHVSHYYADLVLNQGFHADPDLYLGRERHTRLLLGTRYTLLRREFLRWQDWRRETPPLAQKVLVTLGGGNSTDAMLTVLEALSDVAVDGLETVAVVGESAGHSSRLQSAVSDSRRPLRLEGNVSDMAGLMAWADVAVSGGGGTVWEAAFMGLPALVLTLADNQAPIAEGLDAFGAALSQGRHGTASPSQVARALTQICLEPQRRASMGHRGRRLVDGYGASRVAGLLAELRSARCSDERGPEARHEAGGMAGPNAR